MWRWILFWAIGGLILCVTGLLIYTDPIMNTIAMWWTLAGLIILVVGLIIDWIINKVYVVDENKSDDKEEKDDDLDFEEGW